MTGVGRAWDPSIKFWQGRDGRYHEMRGENARSAKLGDADVAEIKAAPDAGPDRVTHRALARNYGVAECTVRRIRQGVTWTHIPAGTWPPESWKQYDADVRLKGSP